MSDAATALAVATAAHAGFQVTVTALVYPRLAATDAAAWGDVHRRHSRAITPLVAVVYGALVAACGWALTDPRPAVLAAVGAVAVALGTTAALAAPLHGRLGERDQRLVDRLLVVDRVRAVAAVAAVVAASAAAVG